MNDTRVQRLLAVGVNLAVDATSLEVARALRASRVRSIVLKGPMLVRWLYGSDAARASKDIDLLIDADALQAAESVLGGLGFTPVATGTGSADRPRHAATWGRGSDDIDIDLHTTLVGIGVSQNQAWNILSKATEESSLDGVTVEVLAPAARAMHVVLHAAQHGARAPQPLCDLDRALEKLPLEVWQEAAALVAQLDATPAFGLGLALLPEGRHLKEHLQLPAKGSVEAALRAVSPPPLALGLEWLTRVPGMRAKTAFVAHKIVPPAGFMRTWSPLARRGRAGLVAAYLWRPVWLLLRVGPAVLAWSRAREKSQHA